MTSNNLGRRDYPNTASGGVSQLGKGEGASPDIRTSTTFPSGRVLTLGASPDGYRKSGVEAVTTTTGSRKVTTLRCLTGKKNSTTPDPKNSNYHLLRTVNGGYSESSLVLEKPDS